MQLDFNKDVRLLESKSSLKKIFVYHLICWPTFHVCSLYVVLIKDTSPTAILWSTAYPNPAPHVFGKQVHVCIDVHYMIFYYKNCCHGIDGIFTTMFSVWMVFFLQCHNRPSPSSSIVGLW